MRSFNRLSYVKGRNDTSKESNQGKTVYVYICDRKQNVVVWLGGAEGEAAIGVEKQRTQNTKYQCIYNSCV